MLMIGNSLDLPLLIFDGFMNAAFLLHRFWNRAKTLQ
jgi:hypothetical protein